MLLSVRQMCNTVTVCTIGVRLSYWLDAEETVDLSIRWQGVAVPLGAVFDASNVSLPKAQGGGSVLVGRTTLQHIDFNKA